VISPTDMGEKGGAAGKHRRHFTTPNDQTHGGFPL
jgi:hypothetical protein